jgi:copper(I)-binding protein
MNSQLEGWMRAIIAILILLVFLIGSSACSSTDTLTAENTWARPGFQGDNSAIYLTIRNPGDQDDVLIRANSEVAQATEIHLSKMDSAEIMTMERQDQVPIPSNQIVEFSPGGLHIMLVNLSHDLSLGDTISITLTFQNAGEVSVEVEVRQP